MPSARGLFALLALALSPTALPVQAADTYAQVAAQLQIEHHGLLPSEAVEFESRMVPRMRAFLRFWDRRGLRSERTESRLRVYVQPSLWMTKREALDSLYGDTGEMALNALMERVSGMTSVQQIHRELRTFTCQFPPLFHGLAERPAPASAEAFKREIRREYERISDPVRPIPGFETDNGFYLEGAGGCSVLLLGRSSDPAFRPHPFLSEDVLLHELGHGLIEGVVPRNRVVPKAFQETVADLLAHSFLDENCHGLVINPSSGAAVCRRDMNRGGPALAEALWRDDPHRAGDAVRKLLWTLYLANGQERFAQEFGRALASVLLNRPLSKVKDLPEDPFLRVHSEMRSEHQLLGHLIRETCARLPAAGREACGLSRESLGTLDANALERLARNSPTRVGANGRRITVDGRAYRVSFGPGFSPLKLELVPLDAASPMDVAEGARALVCSGSGLFAPEKIAYVSCGVPGGASGELNWTSYGAIRFN